MQVTFGVEGDLSKTEAFLKRAARNDLFGALERYGAMGVAALSAATPIRTGRTAASWTYKISRSNGAYSIEWTNSNMAGRASVAILLQYGHGTGTGGYVAGRDYINPAIRPIFDQIAEAAWKEVTS